MSNTLGQQSARRGYGPPTGTPSWPSPQRKACLDHPWAPLHKGAASPNFTHSASVGAWLAPVPQPASRTLSQPVLGSSSVPPPVAWPRAPGGARSINVRYRSSAVGSSGASASPQAPAQRPERTPAAPRGALDSGAGGPRRPTTAASPSSPEPSLVKRSGTLTGSGGGSDSVGRGKPASSTGPKPPPHAQSSPLPPTPPDHSSGGYTLVSSSSELELMLDQLAAAAGALAGPGATIAPSSGTGRAGGASVLGGAGSGVGPLAVDCEGVQLGRPGGKLCLLQLSARCGSGRGGGGRGSGGGVSIWLVDVEALGWRAFRYRSRLDGATSLKGLLEDPAVVKYLYDVRRDAEALSSEYGIRLRGVVDLQLADVAVRQAEGGMRAGGWVEGLVSALSRGLAAGGRASAPARLAEDLAAATSISRRYHESNNTQVWSRRPLTPELCEYAATDVRYLHALADALSPRMNRELAERVVQESHRRTVNPMSNNKDLRAAAPVMVVRQAAPAAAGVAAAAAASTQSGERLRPGPTSGSVPRGTTAGVPRGATPYMGLMEWLTAALLVRYDHHGLAMDLTPGTAAVMAAVSGRVQLTVGQAVGEAGRQRAGAGTAPQLSRPQAAAFPAPGPRARVTGAAHGTVALDPSEAASAAAAAVLVAVGQGAAAAGAARTDLAVAADLEVAPHPAMPTGALTDPSVVSVVSAGCGLGQLAEAGTAVTNPGPDPGQQQQSALVTCNATTDAAATPPPPPAVLERGEVAPRRVWGDAGGPAAAGPGTPAWPAREAQPMPRAAHVPSLTAVTAEGHAGEGSQVVESPPPETHLVPPGLFKTSAVGCASATVQAGSAAGVDGVGVAAGVAGLVASATLFASTPATGAGTAARQQMNIATAQSQPPPPPPLVVPTMETMTWAERMLSDFWLDLQLKYDDLDSGDPKEEQKLARLAAVWLLGSQRSLVGRAGSRGSGGAVAGRRDPGLRWLLG